MATYLDLTGLTHYDEKIKQYIRDNIPEAAAAFINAEDTSEIYKIAILTQEEYDELTPESDVLYIISDDTTAINIDTQLQQLEDLIDSIRDTYTAYSITDEDVEDAFLQAEEDADPNEILESLNTPT